MKFCPNCGKPTSPEGSFCANCGANLATSTPTPQTTDQPTPSPTPNLSTPSMSSSSTLTTPNRSTPSAPNSPTSATSSPTNPPMSFPSNPPIENLSYKPSNKKKIIKILSTSICSLIAIAIIAAILLNIKGQDRTFMIYITGSNLESEAAAASIDITEMIDSKFNPEHTKVLIYTGGTTRWSLDEISPEENAIFEVTKSGINKLASYPKASMTDPNTLTGFIDYAYKNYPSDLYDLILWDHGGGPVFGYGLDENDIFSDPMKLNKLAESLSNSALIKAGQKFDFIGFDACLMGSIETAAILKDYGHYMIASEENEPGWGWNYNFLSSFNDDQKTMDTEKLGHSIIDSYISHYETYPGSVDLSLAMINLDKIDKLTEPTSTLFANVGNELNQDTFSKYSRTMTREKVYGYNGRNNQSYDLVDILDLTNSLSNLYPDDVKNIHTALKDVVIYNRSNIENTNGLSTYFLNFNKTNAEKLLQEYKDVAYSDKYYDFLTKYKNFVTGEKVVSRSIYDDLPVTKEGSMISVELPDELKDNYQSGEIIIFRKLGENKFMPIYRGSDVTLNGSTLSSTSTDLQFVVEMHEENDKTSYGWITIAEKERTDSYTDYVTYGTLYYNNNSLLGLDIKNYEMYLRLPLGEREAIVRDIKVAADPNNNLSSKISFDESKIKIINFFAGTYKLFNEDGVQNDNFESWGDMFGSEVNLEKGDTYKIKLENLDYDFGDMYGDQVPINDYYAEFIVHDTRGNSHRLNLIQI